MSTHTNTGALRWRVRVAHWGGEETFIDGKKNTCFTENMSEIVVRGLHGRDRSVGLLIEVGNRLRIQPRRLPGLIQT
jgi:hypothetical protein